MTHKEWLANHLSETHAMGVDDSEWEQNNLDVFHSYFHARAEGMPDFDAGRDLETGVVGRCPAVFDGYRCVDPEQPQHKYHAISLFTEVEEARMEPWTARRLVKATDQHKGDRA